MVTSFIKLSGFVNYIIPYVLVVLQLPLVVHLGRENGLLSTVIIKLTVGELDALANCGGEWDSGFSQFIEAIQYRIDEETGELDIDDEDVRTINKYRETGHKRALDRIFKRPIDDAMRRFLGS